MSGRENILRRARLALRTTAPKCFEWDGARAKEELFPTMEKGSEALCRRFAEELAALRGEFLSAADSVEANKHLQNLVGQSGFKKIAAQDSEMIRHVCDGVKLRWLRSRMTNEDATEQTGGGRALADFDLAITGCDALVARTGSVVLTAKSAGGRALSVLPPNHLVIAHRSQLVPDLADALSVLRKKYGERLPSFISVITGPSRTADIEKILVLGAHGPKRLFVMVITGQRA